MAAMYLPVSLSLRYLNGRTPYSIFQLKRNSVKSSYLDPGDPNGNLLTL